MVDGCFEADLTNMKDEAEESAIAVVLDFDKVLKKCPELTGKFPKGWEKRLADSGLATGPTTTKLTLRMPMTLVAALDELSLAAQKSQPWRKVGRSEVVRTLLLRALLE